MQNLGRRSFMIAMNVSAMVTLAAGPVSAKPRTNFFSRKSLPIGLQIYSLGPDVGKDIDATFATAAAIGYREIELPNLLGHKPAELAAAAARAGLKIGSLHLPLLRNARGPGLSLASETAKIVDALGTLGAQWAVAPLLLLPEGFRPQQNEGFEAAVSRSIASAGVDIWKQSAEQLNKVGHALKSSATGLAYHNHNLDFAPVGKTTGWDILWRETDPASVSFEVDIGWVATAGLDPVRFLDKYRGRLRLMHVRDVPKDMPIGFQIAMRPSEVGVGTLPWARILPAAHRAGVRHFFVEQETVKQALGKDAAKRAYDFLSKLSA